MSEPMGVKRALEVAIDASATWDIPHARKWPEAREAAAVLRRLLDSGFLEAAIRYVEEYERPVHDSEATADEWFRLRDAYRAFTKEPE